MTGVDLLAAWRSIPADRRERISTAIASKVIADKLNAYTHYPSSGEPPRVAIVGAVGDGDRVTAHFVVDYYLYCQTISGSDWAEHCIYTGRAVDEGEAPLSVEILEDRTVHLTELESDHYERDVCLAGVLAEQRAMILQAPPPPPVDERARVRAIVAENAERSRLRAIERGARQARTGATEAEPLATTASTPMARPSTSLGAEEIQAFWAVGCAIEARYVPADELVRAIRDRRVMRACSSSSMGTAETFWEVVDGLDAGDAARRRDDLVVLPPGQRVEPTSWPDRIDDRDVVGALWQPFWREQELAVCSGLDGNAQTRGRGDLARLLARIEGARRLRRPRSARDAALLALLREVGEGSALDPERLATLLASSDGVAALATRVRRVLCEPSLHKAMSVVLASVPDEARRDLRFEILRLWVGVARRA